MQKNFAVFIVACLAIIMGWLWMQNQLWPPRRPDQQAAKADDKKADDKKADDKKKAEEQKPDDKGQKKEEKKEDKKEEKKEVKPEVPEVKPEVKKPEPREKRPSAETYTLGNDNTHLSVVVTTLGAGIQKLTLNRFQAANYVGEPVNRNLELLQEDPFQPSFRMYHYPNPEADNPIFGLGEKVWKFEGQEVLEGRIEQITLSTTLPGNDDIKITKTYRLGPRDYHVTLLLEFEHTNRAGKELKLRYQLTGGHCLPVEGEWYTSTFRKGVIGVLEGANLDRDLSHEDAFVISHRQGGDRSPAGTRSNSATVLMSGVSTQYFASMICPDDQQPDKEIDRKAIIAWARPTLESTERHGTILFYDDEALTFGEPGTGKPARFHLLPHVRRHIEETGLKKGDKVMLSSYDLPDGERVATWVRRGKSPRPYLDDITVRVNSEPVDLQPGVKKAHQFLLYHGPVKVRQLSQYSGNSSVEDNLIDRYADKLHLSSLTDYRSPGPFGAFAQKIMFTNLLIACTKLMHLLLYFLSFVAFGNYGLSIILLTVLVRGLMFPISKKQAMFSIKMQTLGPEMKKVQEKFKNDPQGKTQATMELYRKHNVHPLGGCLPLVLQLPIFLGLYYALQESIHFRLAGFLWIDNLAAPDMLRWWGEVIPWVSDPDNQGGFFYLGPYFNLLPLFAVGLMFVQQKLMTPPAMDEQQAIQQKTFQFMMIFMGIVFYKVASGLCIYFIASSAWGLAERKLLPKKKIGEAVVAVSTNGKAASMRGKGKPSAPDEPDGMVQRLKDWWTELLEKARKK